MTEHSGPDAVFVLTSIIGGTVTIVVVAYIVDRWRNITHKRHLIAQRTGKYPRRHT